MAVAPPPLVCHGRLAHPCLTGKMRTGGQPASGTPRNLRITGNRFENRFGVHAACSYPVAVDPSLSPPWIRGIDLRDNRFCPGPDGWAIQTHHTRRCCFDGGFID